MANQDHLKHLKQGVAIWNEWRETYPGIIPDLSGARLMKAWLQGANLSRVDLSEAHLTEANLDGASLHAASLYEARFHGARLHGADLTEASLNGAYLNRVDLSKAHLRAAKLIGASLIGADLSGADLSEVHLGEAYLNGARLSGANLRGAHLGEAYLSEADLQGADLRGADLHGVDLRGADLRGARLVGANLQWANLSQADLSEADLTRCSIYGLSAWNVQLRDAIQSSLIITATDKPIITIDRLRVAQFIYLLLNNEEVREVIPTITSKIVLIVGRFMPGRQVLLDALRDELQTQHYVPVVVEGTHPVTPSLSETISVLAHLARFIIVDLTDSGGLPQEVATIVSVCAVPIQPLIAQDDASEALLLFQDLRQRYHWVLPTFRSQDSSSLPASLKEHVIGLAEQKAQELERLFPFLS